jgi:hypothetical protein
MTKRVLVAGAGVAAVEAILALRQVGGGDFAIDIVAPAQALEHRPTSVAAPSGLGTPPPLDPADLASRGDLSGGRRAVRAGPRQLEGEVSPRALGWPPGRVAGRYLAAYLATAQPRELAEALLVYPGTATGADQLDLRPVRSEG